MRSKIRVDGLWYRPVPWYREGECDGCYFHDHSCINTSARNNPCDDGNEFTGMVFIPNTKEAYAEYIHKAVLYKFDKAQAND